MTARSTAPDFYRIVEAQVRKAVARPENLTPTGVNWNYVDADVFMAVNPSKNCEDLFYNLLEEACEYVEKESLEAV